MIELIRVESGISVTKEKYEYFDIRIDDELMPEIMPEKWDDGKVEITLDEQFNFSKLLKRFGNYKIPELVCHEKKPVSFFISDFSIKEEYYQWEKIFFGCLQEMRINHSNGHATIGLSFCLFEKNLSGWTYQYPPKDIFFQSSRIRHDKVDIVTKEEIDHISFQIDLKKEFATTLNLSYKDLKTAIYEVEQELYQRLENTKATRNK